jgi:hypothetical protein
MKQQQHVICVLETALFDQPKNRDTGKLVQFAVVVVDRVAAITKAFMSGKVMNCLAWLKLAVKNR